MKKLFIFAAFIIFTKHALAQQKPQQYFDLPKVSGEPSDKSNADLETEINGLNTNIGNYPPQFKDDNERTEVFQKWSTIYSNLRLRLTSNDKDENLWGLFADVLRQGHNLNVRTAAALANHALKECFTLNPISVKCHTVASMFYLSLNTEFLPQAQKSLDFLKKHYAPQLNEDVERAQMLYYILKNDPTKAKEQIDFFISKFPNSTQIKYMLAVKKALDNGGIRTAGGISNNQELGHWMVSVFKIKDISKLESAIVIAAENKLFSSPKKMSMIQSFFVTLFKIFPKSLPIYMATLGRIPEEQIPYALLPVHYAQLKNGKQVLEKYLKKNKSAEIKKKFDELSKDKMENPYTGQITPTSLDMLWSEFFVSGALTPLKRILEAFALEGDGSAMASKAAHWSLLSNAKNIPGVLPLLKDLQKTNSLKELAEIIQQAEK